MNNTAKVGVAVASGYLMGRSKKAKLAFALGTWMMGKRLSLDAGKLAREGLSALTSSPELTRLTDEVRDELLGAGRAAAISMLTQRVEKLADSLHQRTEALTGGEPEASEQDGEPKEKEEEEGEPGDAEDREHNGEEEHDQDEGEDQEDEDEDEDGGHEDEDEEDEERGRPRSREGSAPDGQRSHRRTGRTRVRSSAHQGEHPAARAGSARRRVTSADSPPPRRSRATANSRRTAAKAARPSS